MKQLKIFIELTRLNKPIGYMLLFWPCAWGLAYAYIVVQDLNKFLYYLLLFFLGSMLMRSAGCIVNDIVDRDIDTKVQRTKNRPLASNSISIKTFQTFQIFSKLQTYFKTTMQILKLNGYVAQKPVIHGFL
mgnify:CR=1 FL=1